LSTKLLLVDVEGIEGRVDLSRVVMVRYRAGSLLT
jgi:hypothetical protein